MKREVRRRRPSCRPRTQFAGTRGEVEEEHAVTTPEQTPDMSAIKERMQKIWTSGEYARIGNPISIMGELLCEAADVRSGERVLDVATGSGNTAISAARRFCEVTGMDLAPESIEHARRRAEAEGMEITFEVGDAEDLSYPDAGGWIRRAAPRRRLAGVQAPEEVRQAVVVAGGQDRHPLR